MPSPSTSASEMISRISFLDKSNAVERRTSLNSHTSSAPFLSLSNSVKTSSAKRANSSGDIPRTSITSARSSRDARGRVASAYSSAALRSNHASIHSKGSEGRSSATAETSAARHDWTRSSYSSSFRGPW